MMTKLVSICSVILLAAIPADLARGQDVTYETGNYYTFHVWTNTATVSWSPPFDVQADVLVVAGGGSGGSGLGAGGGAGGVVLTNLALVGGSSYEISVGDGGLSSTVSRTAGFNGENSSFDTLVAEGGGGGGAWNDRTGRDGGSGGGSANTTRSSGVSGQGRAGGIFNDNYRTGGGGGYSQQGEDGIAVSPVKGGDGGDGIDLTGWLDSVALGDDGWFAGGGGGTDYQSDRIGFGGRGGGGDGGRFTANVGAGMAATGGGGGAAGDNSQVSGAGGSGIVVIRYRPFEITHPVTGNLTYTGSNTVDVMLQGMPGYTHYQITEDDTEPMAGWLAYDSGNPPTGISKTFAIPDPEDEVMLYAWFSDASTILPVTNVVDRIRYTTDQPSAVATATLALDTYAGATVPVTLAQVDNGSTGGSVMIEGDPVDLDIFDIGIGVGSDEPAETIYLGPGVHTVTLTVMNEAGNTDTATCTVTVTDGGDATTTVAVTWSGGAQAPNYQWFRGQNWTGGVAPTNPTPGTINYGAGGQGVVGLLAADWQVGGVNLPDGAYTHAIDLGGNVLTVAGTFHNQLQGVLTLTNGTLRVGTDTVPGNVFGGGGSTTPAVTVLCPGMTFDPYHVDTIRMGLIPTTHINNKNARLDLRGVTVTGGILGATNIMLHAHYRQTLGSYIAIDETTSVNAIIATNQLIVGRGLYGGRIFIGDPDDTDRRLPPNIDIRVGRGTGSGERGVLEVGSLSSGSSAGTATANITLAATSGGDLVAYLTDLTVMRYNGTGTATLNGTLDLSAMTNVVIDTGQLEVGVNVQGTLDGNPRGTIKLPAGTLVTGAAVIGGSAGLGYGRFETSNTVVTVTNSLLLDLTGEITITMGDTPKGIDVEGPFTDGGGSIHVNFQDEPAVAESTNWAFRVAGDVSTELNAMVGSGRLTSSDAFAGWQTGVLYDGTYTYFAMVDESISFPPVAVAKDAAFEIEPSGTVWVDISEVDDGSHDPSSRTPASIRLSKDTINFDTTQSFTTVGDHPVTVKIEVGNPVEEEATDTATVSLVDLDPGTDGNVTWLGDASTVLMDRREWWWSGSWLGGVPPTNPTPGTITFAQYGQGITSVLEQDRQVGRVLVSDANYNHTMDFNSNTLTVAGEFRNILQGTFVLTNGTLLVGTDTVPGSVRIGAGNGAATACTLQLKPGMTFDGHWVSDLYLDSSSGTHVNNMNGRFDLRGVTIADGVLGASNIWIETNNRNSGGSYIALDTNTVIGTIAVTNELHLGGGSQRIGRAFIGDPGDVEQRLPPNIDIHIGSAAARGSLELAGDHSGGGSSNDIRLRASSGGELIAYLTDMTVMRYNGTGTSALAATLDLSAMTNAVIETETVGIGLNVQATADGNPQGTVRLPPGTVTAGTVEVGASAGSATAFGLLTMSNTAFTVTNILTIAKTGDVVVDIGGEPTGIDIVNADLAALAVDADATLTLRFFEPAAQQPHYGFRWSGDHAATLETMLVDGRLVIDDAGLGGRPAVIYTLQGDTHVGVPPPPGSLFLLR